MKIDLTKFSAELLAVHEIHPRAKVIARAVAGAFPGASVIVYTAGLMDGEEAWIPQTVNGERNVQVTPVAAGEGTLGKVAIGREPIVFAGSELTREDFAHLDIRRTLRSLACLPLESDGELLGVVEILSFENEIKTTGLKDAESFTEVAAAGLQSAFKYESERNDALASISRLTQLYDIGKIFSSTLEMDELLVLIGDQISRSDGMPGDESLAAAAGRNRAALAPVGLRSLRRCRQFADAGRRPGRQRFPIPAKHC